MLHLPRAPEWKDGVSKYCQVKRDGIQVHASQSGCFTKHPTDITTVCRQIPTMQSVWRRLPLDVWVVGEAYVPGKPASEVKSAFAHDPSRCRFEAFACSDLEDTATMPELAARLTQYGFLMPPLVDSTDQSYDDLYVSLDDLDVEGFVLKDSHLLGWKKWKPVHTIDLVVCDTIDGKGKNLGLIGSLVCKTAEGHIVANAGGMTSKERIEMSLDDDLIGKVVEVAYQYVGAKGRLRHPRFIRFRDDKHWSSCETWQDPRLKEYWG